MLLHTAKIVSPASPTCWSQVFIQGDFLIVIKIGADKEAAVKGKEISTRLQDYYQQTAGKNLARLETAFKKIEQETAGMNLELVVGIVLGQVLYLGILQRGRVVLSRNGKIITLLKGEDKPVFASGFLQENDLFILGTEGFYQVVLEEISKDDLGKKTPTEVVEMMTPIIHQSTNGGLAAIFFKAVKKELIGLPAREKTGKPAFIRKLVVLKESLAQLFKPIEPRPAKKEQQMMMTIAVALVFLLFISVIFGWQKKRDQAKKEKFRQIWEQIEQKYQEGSQLAATNPILSRKLLNESLDLAKINENYSQIKELKSKIEAELEKVIKEYELGELPVFLDLNLIKQGLKGLDFEGNENEIALLGEDGTIISLDFNKKAEIKGKVEKGKLITLLGEKILVLGDKIVAVNNNTLIEKDWTEAIGLASFSGNLYLLEKNGEIWKYSVIESGFGSKRKWLVGEGTPDLKQAIDFTVDGDVWILLEEGKILKFSRGEPQAFGMAGLDKGFNQPIALYTNQESQFLYLLDQGNQRIVVFLKSGEYDSQYLSPDIGKARDLIVNEKKKKMLLLNEDKIWEIDLR